MTLGVLTLTVVFLIAYDIYIMLKAGGVATISWQTWMVSKKYPIIPFAVGIVAGHLFWVQTTGCLNN